MTALSSLDVLVLDCQSTGANPRRGSLLEIAWSRGDEVVSHLVRLPRGRKVPAHITRITGIEDSHMVDALPPASIWRRLRADYPGRVMVAHFARFERRWIEALCPASEGNNESPFEILCTHEIVCRLMPGLPRRGLRAVAGYFGHVLGERKRAADHVRATMVVWRELVARLAREAGVATMAQLRAWMESVEPVRRTGRDFPIEREARLALPDAPGVYRMLGKGGQVLYLGKATSLKKRVNSYFQHKRHGGDRKREMLTQTFNVEVVVTASPLEAALQESDEIKKHAPAYNVALRERDRKVWFASADLTELQAAPDADHRLGPLPRQDALEPLAALRLLPGSRATWMRALGVPESVELDGVCLREGLAQFCDAHGYRFSLDRLLRLGARLWRERAEREEEAAHADEDEDADEEAEEKSEELTPTDIKRRLESSVRHATHLVRRARWFARLCEASLVWRPRDADPRLLHIERGAVSVRGEDVAPPGAERALLARLRCFDAATYDRLRVLTTEMRRVVAEGAPLELRLGRHVRLDRDRLARRLFWL